MDLPYNIISWIEQKILSAGSNPVGRTTYFLLFIIMKVGNLVKLNIHSHFTSGINDIIGIPFETIGIVLQERCDVCSVIFPLLEDEIRSFMKADLEIVSESG